MQTSPFPVLIKNFPFLLYYRGNYKTDLSLNIFEIVNGNLSLHFQRNFVSRLSYLVIECLQNVMRYSETQGTTSDYCLVYSDADYCHIITKNMVSRMNIENLEKRLIEVKAKTTEEIEETYKLVLRSKTMTSKGAGLGLIDMARKTGNRMDYEIEKVSEQEWAYSLHIKLPIPTKEISASQDEENHDAIIKSLIERYNNNENTFLYSGDFSNTFLMNLLNLITEQYKSDRLLASSIFKYALIELNQNIHRHALSFSEGKISALLSIEWLKESMVLSTSNFLSDDQANKLSAKLDALNHSSQEELIRASEEMMGDESSHGGLGLIDIARLNWPNPIEYAVVTNDEMGKSINLKIEFGYGQRTF